MVDRYYNSGAFEKSLSYLLEKYESPFECFYKLYEFFKNSGYNNAPQSRLKLYDILYEYEKDDVFSSYLLFDLLKYNKGAALPFWAKRTDKEFSKKVSAFLSENRCVLDENLRGEKLSDIMKFVRVYPFSKNVLSNGENENICILFDYKNGKEYRIEVNYEK